MKKQIIIALKVLLVMTVLTGIVYPLLVTGIAQTCFHRQANGSLITKNGVIIGSELIGQKFDSTRYFWSRPSATDYNPLPSGGSNFGPTSKTLKKLVDSRRSVFADKNRIKDTDSIPAEMIFASASGLDPHISPQAAMIQVDRIAENRNFTARQKQELVKIIRDMSEKPQFSLLGEARINVLMLNLELDNIR
ncbi:MAG: potassium-transporting ATPase subunit KdpC [Bacteroidota bacterium]|nr:potassium-transporting ATPase subunit KdpC [Bacteroidota bacterium]